jgi:acyl carrier protein
VTEPDADPKVRAVLAAVRGLRPDDADRIDAATSLFDPDGADTASLGLDSLNMMELILTLDERNRLVLPAGVDPWSIRTVGSLAGALRPAGAEGVRP